MNENIEETNYKKNTIQWQPMIEMIIVLFTILGSTIPLYLHTDSKLETTIAIIRQECNEFRAESREIHREIQNEIRDFHQRIIKIEERPR